MFPTPSVRFGVHKPIDKTAIINNAALDADFSATIDERLAGAKSIVDQLKSRFGIVLNDNAEDYKNGVKAKHNDIEIRFNTGTGTGSTMAAVKAGLTQILGPEKSPGKFIYTVPNSTRTYEVTAVPTQQYLILKKKPGATEE